MQRTDDDDDRSSQLDDGGISVQGHWRESDTKPVFPIIGGGLYHAGEMILMDGLIVDRAAVSSSIMRSVRRTVE
jgi:hypothetical protein